MSKKDIFFKRRPAVKTSPWFVIFNPQEKVRIRIFCFPYAGGDANIYRDWALNMPDGVEVVGVQYPGRGGNTEPLISCCDEMVARLYSVISPMLNVNFAFFGHSNGGLISYVLVGRMSDKQKSNHIHLFISARSPAHLDLTRKKISHLEKHEFVQEIKEMGGTPEAVLKDEGLIDYLIPRLRADFRLGESYRYRKGGEQIECAVSILFGSDDGLVDNVDRWSDLVVGEFSTYELAGGHFYIHTNQQAVIDIVLLQLNESLAGTKERGVPA
ncbi:thioesterase [Endozoicomonas sp. SM1973]|uniref:Thioesterase n=1 Tax=Spartinivicinus marinus TaxID=2994442 RepID=A0A853I6W1_9GAMM|nr:thioesterase [Spartinivicinus marinus]MCX4030110.1 thioesterase domain-containing protein [Spartinivicinus marinus]NYZ69650.1 thioesterase [Spartinivicinus marinus]